MVSLEFSEMAGIDMFIALLALLSQIMLLVLIYFVGKEY